MRYSIANEFKDEEFDMMVSGPCRAFRNFKKKCCRHVSTSSFHTKCANVMREVEELIETGIEARSIQYLEVLKVVKTRQAMKHFVTELNNLSLHGVFVGDTATSN